MTVDDEEEPTTGNGLVLAMAAGASLLCAGSLTGDETLKSLGVVFGIASGLAAFIHLPR